MRKQRNGVLQFAYFPFNYRKIILSLSIGVTLGSILLILGTIIVYRAYSLKKLERNYKKTIEKLTGRLHGSQAYKILLC